MLFSVLSTLFVAATSVLAAPIPHRGSLLARGASKSHAHSSGKSTTSVKATATTSVKATATVKAAAKQLSKGSKGSNQRADNAPHFVIYADTPAVTPPDPSTIGGFNNFVLAFWLSTSGPADSAAAWAALDQGTRQQIRDSYHAAGKKITVAAFGFTDRPTTQGADPTATAQALAQFVQDYDLDGADIDYEDFDAATAGTMVQWLVTFQSALRSALGDEAVITHAPVAPWFTDSASAYPGGAYLAVHQQVGETIDAYNLQYYNQGDGTYSDCTSLISTSNLDAFPHTSILEIMASGVPGDKLVLGKPGGPANANNGYVDAATLATCVAQGKAGGWNGGLMIWQYPAVDASFVDTVWGAVTGGDGGGGDGPTTTAPPDGPSTTSTPDAPSTTTTPQGPTTTDGGAPGGGPTGTPAGCGGAAAWDAATAYTAGTAVTYQGSLWTATTWSYNSPPGGAAAAWQQGGAC